MIYGDNLRPPPFCCLFLSSLPSTSGHVFPGFLQAPFHGRKHSPSGVCVLHTQKAPGGLGCPRMAPYSPAGALVNCSPLRLLWTLPCSHVVCLPRGGQGDCHLHNTMFGTLAAGLKIGNHKCAGDLLGHVGEAAGGYDVRFICGGTRTTGVVQKHRQAREAQEDVEREHHSAIRRRRKGNWK